MKKNNTSKAFGERSETRATAFLESRGFLIVERNYYAQKLGEIDIIAQKNGVLHFVEVKSAKADFDPIYNLTPSKLKKLILSTHHYLKVRRLDIDFSIDALIIRGDEIEMLENITM